MHDVNEPTRLSVSAFWVDARKKACPLPIIELARALQSNDLVELWADDPAAWNDVHAFLSSTGHRLVKGGEANAFVRAVVQHRGRG
jgi:TusA-related sulfurtransferase